MSKAAKLKKKRVEDVLGGEEAWKNAPRSQSALPPAPPSLPYCEPCQAMDTSLLGIAVLLGAVVMVHSSACADIKQCLGSLTS